eukprot:5511827-Prymnesium_polylepis.1
MRRAHPLSLARPRVCPASNSLVSPPCSRVPPQRPSHLASDWIFTVNWHAGSSPTSTLTDAETLRPLNAPRIKPAPRDKGGGACAGHRC